MNLILAITGGFLLLFTAVMVWTWFKTGGIPDTLCTCVFSVCGGECGVMGWIKTTKDKMQDRQWRKEDKEEYRNDGN